MPIDLFNYRRRTTTNVHVGRTPLGSNHPVRLQSMNTTSTDDVEGSIAQAGRIISAGADYVRLTTQGLREVESLGRIRDGLRAQGIRTPLVADVHFNPNVADEAAKTVEAVRINPGNYVDPARQFRHIEYTDDEYRSELERLEERFNRLLDICKSHRTALRIGVNHGSLSDRIMSRYGDTPAGIVESCMEFLRVCVRRGFSDVVVSIKASNPVVMVQSVRLLVKAMDAEGMQFPLHLGVTEAGAGEDGRIKSALGIGALLSDGLGDTVRVSLSEAPENEIPVARKLVDYILLRRNRKRIEAREYEGFNYVCPERRATCPVLDIGGSNRPVVIGESCTPSDYDDTIRPDYVIVPDISPASMPDTRMRYIVEARRYDGRENTYPLFTTDDLNKISACRAAAKFLELAPFAFDNGVAECLRENPDTVLMIKTTSRNCIGEARAIIHTLMREGIQNPVVFAKPYDHKAGELEDFQIESAADTGALIFDGLLDGLCITCSGGRNRKHLPARDVLATEFSILQAAGQRITKTEYISCPGCGRTLYDLEGTLARIKAATQGMVGVKIAVMGCIVNGPGEMADADYGYVGAARGKVSLYRRKECVERNIPEDEAVAHLLALIKSDREGTQS